MMVKKLAGGVSLGVLLLALGGSIAFGNFRTGGIGSGASNATTSSDIQGYFPYTAQKADAAASAFCAVYGKYP